MRRQGYENSHAGLDHRADIWQWLQWVLWGEYKKRVYIYWPGLEKEYRCFSFYNIGKKQSPISQTEILQTALKTNELRGCMSAADEIT